MAIFEKTIRNKNFDKLLRKLEQEIPDSSWSAVRGRAAWVPDFLWVGTVLTLLQSYAAGQSPAGVLRWYMAAAGFAGAGAAAFVLGVPLRMAGKALQRRVLRPAAQRRVRQQNARKLRRNAKRTAKKRKKNLPNRRRMMYNS